MKSFEQFNTEAMVHHIALKEGMSYDELSEQLAGGIGIDPVTKAIVGGVGLVGGWALNNLQKALTKTRPVFRDYGQSGTSTYKPKPKPEVTATPTVVKPKPEVTATPTVVTSKADRTPEGRGKAAAEINRQANQSADIKPKPKPEPEPPKPEPPKQADQPLVARSSKTPGQRVNVPRGRSGESLTIKPSTRMSRLGSRVGAVVRPTGTAAATAALGGDADRTITPDKRKPYYGPGGDPSGSGKGQAKQAAVSSDAVPPKKEEPKEPKPAVSTDKPKPKPKPRAAVPPSERQVEPVQSAGFNVKPWNLPPNTRIRIRPGSSGPYTRPKQ